MADWRHLVHFARQRLRLRDARPERSQRAIRQPRRRHSHLVPRLQLRGRRAARGAGLAGKSLMSTRAEAFDGWIRGSFVALNTELEDLYFRREDRARVEGIGDALKATLRDEG